MTALAKEKFSVEAFLDWAEGQDRGRYELIGGEIVAMAPERAEHAHVKRVIANALDTAIAKAKLPCRAFVDGLGVRIDDETVFEPDALVNCGDRLKRGSMIAPNPVIVVEVVSPSSKGKDFDIKLLNYFRHPGVHHYLIVLSGPARTILHSRASDGTLITRICGVGDKLYLDPPGITVAVADLFDGLSDLADD